MNPRAVILLKLTGEALLSPDKKTLDSSTINNIAQQIKHLNDIISFGIVIGGGNFFRGRVQGKQLNLTESVGHQIGMLATQMNGLILKDLFEKNGLTASLFCAVATPQVGNPISRQEIKTAQKRGDVLIFAGGTGNPFFTTDTTAVLRGLEIGASEIWKATSVDGIYDSDPRKFPNAKFIKKISYINIINQKLGIMDPTSFALAEEHNLEIRVFNIFEKDTLIKAANDKNFGSTIVCKG